MATMQKSKEPISDRFQRDITDHRIEIRHEDGVYRHVVFKRPDTVCMMFSLTTTPGRLIYAGDMGCFVFERLFDMFEFFRDKDNRQCAPNFSYWHEKLVAVCRHGSEEHDADAFRENLHTYVTDELSDEDRAEVTEFINSVVETFSDEGPTIAYRNVSEFSLDSPNGRRRQFFQDFFDFNDRRYTLHYEWACHAIQWGIRVYDDSKSKGKDGVSPPSECP